VDILYNTTVDFLELLNPCMKLVLRQSGLFVFLKIFMGKIMELTRQFLRNSVLFFSVCSILWIWCQRPWIWSNHVQDNYVYLGISSSNVYSSYSPLCSWFFV